jgi:SMC interacting uncharacterized protein involved in chromosome segregation
MIIEKAVKACLDKKMHEKSRQRIVDLENDLQKMAVTNDPIMISIEKINEQVQKTIEEVNEKNLRLFLALENEICRLKAIINKKNQEIGKLELTISKERCEKEFKKDVDHLDAQLTKREMIEALQRIFDYEQINSRANDDFINILIHEIKGEKDGGRIGSNT